MVPITPDGISIKPPALDSPSQEGFESAHPPGRYRIHNVFCFVFSTVIAGLNRLCCSNSRWFARSTTIFYQLFVRLVSFTLHPTSGYTLLILRSGDSYTATGFSFSGSLPSLANPIGNPAFPAESSSGGAGWISDLTGTYNRSLTLSYDLAVSGAVVDKSLINPSTAATVDLVGQTTIWDDNAKHHQHTGSWTADNSLCVIWFGVNDIEQGYTTSDPDSLYEKDMSAYFTHAIHLYDSGLKNFAFLGVPRKEHHPMSLLTPLTRSQPSIERRSY